MPAWESWGGELWWWLAGLALSGAATAVGALGLIVPIPCGRGKLGSLTGGWRTSAVCGFLLLGGLVAVGWQVWRGSEVAPLIAPIDLNAADEEFRLAHFPDCAVRTAPPDPSYNCHGWTFANGRHALSDLDVSQRLESESWQPVDDPAPGDIIVYFGTGVIQHTGIVRSQDDRGQVWVESKWGDLGRYVHPAHVANYAAEYTFYRRATPTMAE